MQTRAFPRGTPAAFVLWRVTDCAFAAGHEVAANPGDPPAPACAQASGAGSISWCLQVCWAGGGHGPGTWECFLSTQQQGVWQEAPSDALEDQQNPRGDNMSW